MQTYTYILWGKKKEPFRGRLHHNICKFMLSNTKSDCENPSPSTPSFYMVMLSGATFNDQNLHLLHLVSMWLCYQIEKQPKNTTPTKSRCRNGVGFIHLVLVGFLYKCWSISEKNCDFVGGDPQNRPEKGRFVGLRHKILPCKV